MFLFRLPPFFITGGYLCAISVYPTCFQVVFFFWIILLNIYL